MTTTDSPVGDYPFASGPDPACSNFARLDREQPKHRPHLRSEDGVAPSPTLLLDTVCGAALNHVITTTDRLRSRVFRRAVPNSAELVDFIIRGLDTNPQLSKRKNR